MPRPRKPAEQWPVVSKVAPPGFGRRGRSEGDPAGRRTGRSSARTSWTSVRISVIDRERWGRCRSTGRARGPSSRPCRRRSRGSFADAWNCEGRQEFVSVPFFGWYPVGARPQRPNRTNSASVSGRAPTVGRCSSPAPSPWSRRLRGLLVRRFAARTARRLGCLACASSPEPVVPQRWGLRASSRSRSRSTKSLPTVASRRVRRGRSARPCEASRHRRRGRAVSAWSTSACR